MTTEQEFLGNEKIKRILLRDGSQFHIKNKILVKIDNEPLEVDKYDKFILLNGYGQEVIHLDNQGKVLWGIVPPFDGPEYCPEREHHGKPLRMCNNCSWIEEKSPVQDMTQFTRAQLEDFKARTDLLTETDKAYLRNADGEVIATKGEDGKYYSAEQLDKAVIPLIKAKFETSPGVEAFPTPKPGLGRVVHYKLTSDDARSINARREDAEMKRPGDARSGVMVHVGNRAHAGDVYAATIVRVWNEQHVNLQVQTDGNDLFWACSVQHGEDEGEYIWPPRV